MATVKLPDKPQVTAVVEGDSLVLVRDGAVKRLPLALLATVEDMDTLTDDVMKYMKTVIAGAASASVYVYNIGSEGLDISTLDFSQYAAGDVILVVADMGGDA